MRKLKKPKKHDRAPSQTQISISLSKNLLADVDKCAEADNRTRSNWIVMKLAAAIAVEGGQGSSTKYSMDPAPRGITLNEVPPVKAKSAAGRSKRS